MSTKTPENALSLYNPGEIKTKAGFYKALLYLHDLQIEHCVPAIVREYDRKTGVVKVQPLIYNVAETPDGEVEFSRPEYEVQVRNIRHGGFEINIPLFAGDTGWLISCDRNATTAKEKNAEPILEDQPKEDGENEGEQKPDDASTGGFEFGFFLPDYFGEHDVSDGDGMVIKYDPPSSSDGGSFKMNLSKDGFSINRTGSSSSSVAISVNDSEVSISRSGSADDTVKITDDGLIYDGTPDKEITVVTDMRYDLSSHCVQKKTMTQKLRGDFIVEVGEESDWTTIDGGQAVPETTTT